MAHMFSVIQTMVICGTLLVVALFVLLSLPKSQLRAFLLPIVGWGVAILCGLLCLSPVDLIPEALLGPIGMIDDLGYAVAGVTAAGLAMTSGRREAR